MTKISIFGKTDVGRKRLKNEDMLLIKPDLGVCSVADGMGGEAAGELASQLFIDSVDEVFSKECVLSEQEISPNIEAAFSLANRRIREHVSKHPHHKGMGCTAEVASFLDENLVIGHVGDSRTYCFRNRQLKQLTHDHSLVQKLIDEGKISPEEARRSINRNLILRAVGVEKALHADIIIGKIQAGDLLLLCSDGLTDMVEDTLISDILDSDDDSDMKIEKLIEHANLAGGNDNITIVLCEVRAAE